MRSPISDILVSIVVPTWNSETTIRQCLESIRNQTHRNIELIVIDNYSSDRTLAIAKKFDCTVYQKGTERSAQKNFGASKANGRYILFMDSDMIAPRHLIQHCLSLSEKAHIDAVLLPYLSIGDGYWARCRGLESLFYQAKEFAMPRFFKRECFVTIQGFDERLDASEDIDLYLRLLSVNCRVGLSECTLVHLDKNLSLTEWLRKDVWAMPHVSEYLRKRKKHGSQLPGARFLISFFCNVSLIGSNPRCVPGLFLLKVIDYLTVLFSLVLH